MPSAGSRHSGWVRRSQRGLRCCRQGGWRFPIGWIQGGGLFAVPPFLKLGAQALGDEGDHGAGRPGPRLEQLHHVGGAAPRRQIGHEAPAHPAPARFLAAPGQAAAGPGQLLPVEQAAAGAEHPEAVLASGAGVDAAGLQQLRRWPPRQAGGVARRVARARPGAAAGGGAGGGGCGGQGIDGGLTKMTSRGLRLPEEGEQRPSSPGSR